MSLMQDPPTRAAAVTPSDTVPLGAVRGIYVGVTGNVAIRMKGDTSAVTHVAMPVGFYPMRAEYIYSTGTTATSIVAWY